MPLVPDAKIYAAFLENSQFLKSVEYNAAETAANDMQDSGGSPQTPKKLFFLGCRASLHHVYL
jgi:hypothetical protein